MLLNYSNNMSLFKNFKYEILHLWWTRSGEVGSLEMGCWPMRGGGVLTPPDPPVDPPLLTTICLHFTLCRMWCVLYVWWYPCRIPAKCWVYPQPVLPDEERQNIGNLRKNVQLYSAKNVQLHHSIFGSQ